MQAVFEAHVSAHVACLRLVGALPAGHVFALVDATGRVLGSGQTKGTSVPPPKRGMQLDRRLLDRFATFAEDVSFGSGRVIWWSFRGQMAADDVDVESDPREAGAILQDLLGRHAKGQEDERRIAHALSGVIGAANGKVRHERGDSSPDGLYVLFRSRFAQQRRLPDGMLDDPAFELWLRKRAEQLGT